jgi:hypothetical protein
MQRATVCPSPRPGVKPEDLLTDAEMRQLMTTFTRGKTQVLEDDCVVVLQWAREQRLRSLLLAWVLEGRMQPCVVEGEVCFTASAVAPTGGERTYTERDVYATADHAVWSPGSWRMGSPGAPSMPCTGGSRSGRKDPMAQDKPPRLLPPWVLLAVVSAAGSRINRLYKCQRISDDGAAYTCERTTAPYYQWRVAYEFQRMSRRERFLQVLQVWG